MPILLNIVVVEDHDALREVTIAALQGDGHRVTGVASGQALSALQADSSFPPADLLVLDLNLPGEDGISIAKRIRQSHPEVGIVMVTARGLLTQRLLGYESGADLYLIKPVSLDELRIAIASLTRRLKGTRIGTAKAPPGGITLKQRQLLISGTAAQVEVSASEAQLLAAMAQAPQQRLENWQLVELLGKSESTYRKSNLQVLIFRLRKKLAQAGAGDHAIKVIRQYGYQLAVPIDVV
jgi:DNA-binding response OmpR family regulator